MLRSSTVFARFLAEGMLGPYLILILASTFGEIKAGIFVSVAFAIAAALQTRVGIMADKWGPYRIYAFLGITTITIGLFSNFTSNEILYASLFIAFVTGMRFSFFLAESMVAVMEHYESNRFICTVMFGAAALGGGILLEMEYDLIWPVIAILAVSVIAASLTKANARNDVAKNNIQINIKKERVMPEPWRLTMIFTTSSVFIIGLAIMGSELFFSLIMSSAGHGTIGIGFFWGVEIAAEAVAFVSAGYVSRRVGAHFLVRAAIALLVIRYALLIYNDSTEVILLSQALAGVCFAWYLVGITNMTRNSTPSGQEQQILALVIGTGLGAASVAAGMAGSLVIHFGSVQYIFHACVTAIVFGSVFNEIAVRRLQYLHYRRKMDNGLLL